MSRRRFASLAVLALAIAAACVPAGSTAWGAARCAGGTVAVTINGARACKPARVVAPIRSTDSDATYAAKRVFGTGGVQFAMPKLKNGAALRQAYTPAQAARIVATFRALEATGVAAAVSAVAPRSGTARSLRNRAARIDAPAGVTISEPTVTVTDRSASVSMTATTDDGAGTSTTITAGIEARINDDGTATADVRFGTKITDPSGVVNGAESAMTVLGKNADYCPRANGEIRYAEPFNSTSTSTISQQLGPINSGTITTVRSTSANSTGTGRMNVDATLLPIPFRVKATATLSMQGNGLIGAVGGVLGSFYTMSATATGAGTIDPKTGAIKGDARFDVRAAGSGTPAGRASAARLALDEVRTQVGRQYAHFKMVEMRARAGDCTRLVFKPTSGAALASGETKAVTASLHDRNAGARVPNPVMWTVSAQRGKVTPTTGTKGELATKVTGIAPKAGTTASITYKAVSRVGISTAVWKGVDSPFPKSYSGTIEYRSVIPSPETIFAGSATVVYRLSSATTNPDGSKLALYSVESFSVTSIEQTSMAGGCTFTYGPLAPGAPQTAETSDVEIQVTAQGAWSAAALLGVALGDRVGTAVCPPPLVMPYEPTPKFMLNTRVPSGGLRPMDANGPIVAVGATDTLGSVGNSTATWNLQPGA